MCETIRLKSGEDIGTVRQFQDHFKIDATKYDFDGEITMLDTCLCNIDIEKFLKDHPQYNLVLDCGDWWEK